MGRYVKNSEGETYSTIQEAIDDLGTDGGWVEASIGTFNEAVTITTSGVELRGQGWNTVINGGVTGTAVTTSGSYITVRDLTVQTTTGGGNAYDGIRHNGGNFLKIERVRVNGSDDNGININANVARSWIKNCYIYDTDGDAIDSWLNNSWIVDNEIYTAGARGIYLHASNVIIKGNDMFDITTEGIYLGGLECVISDNTINRTYSHSIDNPASRNIIKSNFIEQLSLAGGSAINVGNVSGAVVSDNYIYLPVAGAISGYGIRTGARSSGVVINCNVVQCHTGLSGILLSGFSHCVTGNKCSTAIQNNSTGSTVQNNEEP